MGEHSAIQWTEATWNPWHGCPKVSPGCKNCYMYSEKKAYGQNPGLVVRSKTKFNDPLKWAKSGNPPKFCFTCSWSDFFVAEADAWRPEAWEIIRKTPQIIYQILTKRPERIADHLPPDWGNGYQNVWLGVSGENQQYMDERVSILLTISAVIHWLSAEPLLGPINFSHDTEAGILSWLHSYDLSDKPTGKLDWVVVGGESGHGARPMNMQWAGNIIGQCKGAKVPVFVKQLGAAPYIPGGGMNLDLKHKKGGAIEEWPERLRVREYPTMGLSQ